MNPTAQQVLTAALNLPEDDRLELVEALIDSSQQPDQPTFDDSWREVIQRRSTELRSGQMEPVSRSDLKRNDRQALELGAPD